MLFFCKKSKKHEIDTKGLHRGVQQKKHRAAEDQSEQSGKRECRRKLCGAEAQNATARCAERIENALPMHALGARACKNVADTHQRDRRANTKQEEQKIRIGAEAQEIFREKRLSRLHERAARLRRIHQRKKRLASLLCRGANAKNIAAFADMRRIKKNEILWSKLNQGVKDLFTESYKTLLKEIKDTNK